MWANIYNTFIDLTAYYTTDQNNGFDKRILVE
jgi:hypothetical protein